VDERGAVVFRVSGKPRRRWFIRGGADVHTVVIGVDPELVQDTRDRIPRM
jgi:hypothetical protein